MKYFLDNIGLNYMWSRIKSWVNSQGFLTSHQSLDNYVNLDGSQTITGVKTFKDSLSYDSTVYAPANLAVIPDGNSVIQSPIPKYLWHDLLAFAHLRGYSTKEYYTSADGSTWTAATLDGSPFMNKDGNPVSGLTSSVFGVRWVFGSELAWSSAAWLVIGVGYNANAATPTFTVEESTDKSTWVTKHKSTPNPGPNSGPCWLRLGSWRNASYVRITITKALTDTGTTNITAIKLLATRWGGQGLGHEVEYPYDWDVNGHIYPITSSGRNLGSSSKKWSNVYAGTFHGALDGNATTATKATQDGNGKDIAATYATIASLEAETTARNMLESMLNNKIFQVQYDLSSLSSRVDDLGGINGHKYVDMGLPSGTLWATVNIGGTAPQDTGKYFQWGDSVGYFAGQVGGDGKQFTWDDYKWTNDGGTTMTKYNSTDGLTELVAADDAARAEWGDGWRMPTTAQLNELLDTDYVTSAWVTDYNGTGVRGRLFTSKVNGNTLFFPAAGNAYNGNVSGANSRGYYANRDTGGNCMYFSSSSCSLAAATRYYGMAVRAVVG